MTKEEELAQAVAAILCAASEQLDIDRLIVALKRQHDVYVGAHPGIAEHIARVGSALTQLDALRESKGKTAN